MKKLFCILVLIATILARTNSLGASIVSQAPMGDTPYQFTNQLWSHVGFGSSNNLANFAMAQVYYIAVGIFDPTNTHKYVDSDPYLIPRTETLPQAVARSVNSELTRLTNIVDGKTLEAMAYLVSPYGDYQFTMDILFIPQKNLNGTHTIPQSSIDSMSVKLQNGGGVSDVFWPAITRGKLIVFNKAGKLIYDGDTLGKPNGYEFSTFANSSLRIPQRLITNGYTGRFIAFTGNTNAVYNLTDGLRVDPSTVVPLVGFKVMNSQKVIAISGAPNQQVTVTCSSNISMTPSNMIVLTLGPVGTLTWTNNVLGSELGFFSVKPYYSP